MSSQKTIQLYIYVDGVNDVPFYGSDAGEYEAFILANGEQYITSEGFVFNVRNVNSGNVNANNLYNSNDNTNSNAYALRPHSFYTLWLYNYKLYKR